MRIIPVFNRRVDVGDIELQQQQKRHDSVKNVVNETYTQFPQPPRTHNFPAH